MAAVRTYAQASDRLTEALGLGLSRPPISISFADSLPPGVSETRDAVPAGCRFWQNASEGTFATSAGDHSLCAIGIYTHNLGMSRGVETDLQDALGVFRELGYVRDQDVPKIPVLQSRWKHVIYGPLAESPVPPHVVMLFVDAAQSLILSEASEGVQDANPPAMGRPACAVVPHVMNTGQAALSLGCCGARAYLDILPAGVGIFALPGDRLDIYVDRIALFAGANVTLAGFHAKRRAEIEAGGRPTVSESLQALS